MSIQIHPTAVVDDGAKIGDGTRIWHFTHVMPGAVIGRDCVFGQNCFVGNVNIGNGVHVQNNVSIYDGVVLEDSVFLGPSCVFTNVKNPRAGIDRKSEYLETLVKRGATIGANATIVCGVTIGEYAFVGAGALVRENVHNYALVVGVPTRKIGCMCACGERLWSGSVVGTVFVMCSACGADYYIDANGVNRQPPKCVPLLETT